MIEVQLPKFVLEIISKFEKAGFEIYIVGGAIRDILMGKIVDDWDFTTNATPGDVLKLFPEAFYDNVFGTVGISQPSTPNPYEITTFRTEFGYTDFRRPDKVAWGKTLEEDLARRDFTINAMALRPSFGKASTVSSAEPLRIAQGKPKKHLGSSPPRPSFNEASRGTPRMMKVKLIDPFAGQQDLEDKLIRAVGDPHARFSEDALRMMRAVRIASELGFLIEEKTFAAIKKNTTLINKIAKERIRDELFKILLSPHPYEGLLIFRNSGLLTEILPELEKCFGVAQKSPGRHHVFDVGTHLLMSLKYCKSDDVITRFATLIHDIGKPQTYKVQPGGTITFYNHEVVSTRIATDIAERLRFSRKERDKLLTLVRWHQFTVDERQTDSAIRRFIRNVGLENVPDMLALRVADRLGGGARETSWRLEEFKLRLIEVQKQPFTVKDLKVDGNDVMKVFEIPPGPKVGETLNMLFDEVVNKTIENDRDLLLKRIKELKSQIPPNST